MVSAHMVAHVSRKHLICNQAVGGSNPSCGTIRRVVIQRHSEGESQRAAYEASIVDRDCWRVPSARARPGADAARVLIAFALGSPAGICAVLHRSSTIDRVVMVTAVAGLAMPSFVLGLLLGLRIAVTVGWLSSGGSWQHAVLPALTTKGLVWSGVVSRHVLPDIASTPIFSMTLAFPEIIGMESGRSFLGLDVQSSDPWLGNVVGLGREAIGADRGIGLAPAFVIAVTTLG